jgi:hypothetical protein
MFSTNKQESQLKQAPNLASVPDSFKRMSKYNTERLTHTDYEVGKMVDEYARLSNVVQFDCEGYIARDIGDKFYLEAAKDTKEYYKYHGMYIISRIYHNISKGSYMNNLSLIRNFKFLPEDESNG